MEKNELKYEFPFRIYNIKTNSFAEREIDEDEAESFDETKLGFVFRPSFAYDEELKLVKVNIVVSYEYEGNQLLKIDTDTIFEFISFDGILVKDGSEDKNVLATLLGIAFSTVRGIIINRTVGSFINKFYLPVINPTEIINDNDD